MYLRGRWVSEQIGNLYDILEPYLIPKSLNNDINKEF